MVTKEAQAELKRLARMANKRIARMDEGRRSAKDYYTRNYAMTEKGNFKTSTAKTEAEYKRRKKELTNFLDSATASGVKWRQVKREAVAKARETLEDMEYEITDKELAILLEEMPKKSSTADYYRYLDLVSAAKEAKGKSLAREEIVAAMSSRVSDFKATVKAVKSRKSKKKNKGRSRRRRRS